MVLASKDFVVVAFCFKRFERAMNIQWKLNLLLPSFSLMAHYEQFLSFLKTVLLRYNITYYRITLFKSVQFNGFLYIYRLCNYHHKQL